jgi:hypothetical protein
MEYNLWHFPVAMEIQEAKSWAFLPKMFHAQWKTRKKTFQMQWNKIFTKGYSICYYHLARQEARTAH